MPRLRVNYKSLQISFPGGSEDYVRKVDPGGCKLVAGCLVAYQEKNQIRAAMFAEGTFGTPLCVDCGL